MLLGALAFATVFRLGSMATVPHHQPAPNATASALASLAIISICSQRVKSQQVL
jgi:hypothetical protein